MKFAIRDDDISYFTSPDHLRKLYEGIWENVPVSFAVIPFIKDKRIIPEGYSKSREYPVGDNSPLVALIKNKISQGMASVMLHGYSHALSKGGYEFERGKNLFEKVRKGREYLERIFNTRVTCFVAPNHALSKNGMKAVIGNNLNIAGAPGIRRRPMVMKYKNIKNMLRLAIFRICHTNNIRYPYPLDYGSHKELYCYGIVDSTRFDELKKGLEFSHKKNGVFCVTVHSRTLNKKKLSVLKELVRESRDIGAEYVTLNNVL